MPTTAFQIEQGRAFVSCGWLQQHQTPYQNVQLELQGGERDFAFRGSLRP